MHVPGAFVYIFNAALSDELLSVRRKQLDQCVQHVHICCSAVVNILCRPVFVVCVWTVEFRKQHGKASGEVGGACIY